MWLYVVACVVVPLAWGIVSTMLMRWVERRAAGRQQAQPHADSPPQEAMWYI